MADELGRQIGRMFKNLRDKTAETVARQEAAFVRGKIAGAAVHDDSGGLIVDAGHVIDDAVIARAERLGRLHQLLVAATSAQVQDLKEKAGDMMGQTDAGVEARSLASVEEFARAQGCIGWVTAMDVTDIRGNVLIPQDKTISREDVRMARDAELLSALISAARPPEPAAAPIDPGAEGYEVPTQRPVRRASVPLVKPSDGTQPQ